MCSRAQVELAGALRAAGEAAVDRHGNAGAMPPAMAAAVGVWVPLLAIQPHQGGEGGVS